MKDQVEGSTFKKHPERNCTFLEHLKELLGPEYTSLLDEDVSDGQKPDPKIYERVMWSFLPQFKFDHTDEGCLIRCPSIVHSTERVRERLRCHEHGSNWRLEDHGNAWSLELQTGDAKAPWVEGFFVDMFADLNGLPSFSTIDLAAYEPSDSPLISCVIALTLNDGFCLHKTIPSIIKNSVGTDIEIIIVHNGIGVDVDALRDKMKNVKFLYSRFLEVGSAYNLGVQHAKGEYVAVFHDDCFLDDANWVDKCISLLKDDCVAVSTEEVLCENDFASTMILPKAVPLVMRTRDYLEIGGYHEMLYGQEEIELAFRLATLGKTVRMAPVSYYHFGGMSVCLLWGKNPGLLKTLFSYSVLPEMFSFAFCNAITLVSCEYAIIAQRSSYAAAHVLLAYPQYFPHATPEIDSTQLRALEPLEEPLLEAFHRYSHQPEAAGSGGLLGSARRRLFKEMMDRRKNEAAPSQHGGTAPCGWRRETGAE